MLLDIPQDTGGTPPWTRNPPSMPPCQGAGSLRGPTLQYHPDAKELTACILKTGALGQAGGSELELGLGGGAGQGEWVMCF